MDMWMEPHFDEIDAGKITCIQAFLQLKDRRFVQVRKNRFRLIWSTGSHRNAPCKISNGQDRCTEEEPSSESMHLCFRRAIKLSGGIEEVGGDVGWPYFPVFFKWRHTKLLRGYSKKGFRVRRCPAHGEYVDRMGVERVPTANLPALKIIMAKSYQIIDLHLCPLNDYIPIENRQC